MEDDPTTSISTLLAIGQRLDSIDRRLDSIEKLGTLVEAALGAVAIQSQNAHKIGVMEARLKVAEERIDAIETSIVKVA